jgi:spore photoproduct lyase
VAGWGYKVGFHFDPILDEPRAGEAYEEVVKKIFATVAPEQVAWISLGALRFNPRLAPIVRERFPNSRILLGEFITGLDGKLRYPRFIRQPLLRRVSSALRNSAPEAWLYLCMETRPVLNQVFH